MLVACVIRDTDDVAPRGHRGLKLAARPTGALRVLALLTVGAPVDLCAVGLGGGLGFG